MLKSGLSLFKPPNSLQHPSQASRLAGHFCAQKPAKKAAKGGAWQQLQPPKYGVEQKKQPTRQGKNAVGMYNVPVNSSRQDIAQHPGTP